jgi:hypothetical protein
MTVKDLIYRVYNRCRVICEGEDLSGLQVTEGLNNLNNLVYALNLENFLAYAISKVTIPAASVPDKQFTIGPTGCDVTLENVPVLISKIYVSYSGNNTELYNIKEEDIYGMMTDSIGVPTVFSYNKSYGKGNVCLDCRPNQDLLVVYNRPLKPYTRDDDLEVNEEYEQLFVYGTALRLGASLNLPDEIVKSIYTEYTNIVDLIKKKVSYQKRIGFGCVGKSHLYNYNNAHNPVQW